MAEAGNNLNLNPSFDTLFEQLEGWIITKNEKGKLKVAACSEDESNVYEKTRDWLVMDVDETKKDMFKPCPSDLYKTARFFIRDLLNSERHNGYFVFKDIPYLDVFFSGTVVSLSERFNKYSIIVDDGTSNIKCLIDKDVLDSIGDNSEQAEVNEIKKNLLSNKKNQFLQAAMMTMQSQKYMEGLIPTYSQLELGEIVKIYGTLSEYNNNRYVFIKKIAKVPKGTTYHTIYLEEMLELYTKYYDQE